MVGLLQGSIHLGFPEHGVVKHCNSAKEFDEWQPTRECRSRSAAKSSEAPGEIFRNQRCSVLKIVRPLCFLWHCLRNLVGGYRPLKKSTRFYRPSSKFPICDILRSPTNPGLLVLGPEERKKTSPRPKKQTSCDLFVETRPIHGFDGAT